jgi:hypothetical protein
MFHYVPRKLALNASSILHAMYHQKRQNLKEINEGLNRIVYIHMAGVGNRR